MAFIGFERKGWMKWENAQRYHLTLICRLQDAPTVKPQPKPLRNHALLLHLQKWLLLPKPLQSLSTQNTSTINLSKATIPNSSVSLTIPKTTTLPSNEPKKYQSSKPPHHPPLLPPTILTQIYINYALLGTWNKLLSTWTQ